MQARSHCPRTQVCALHYWPPESVACSQTLRVWAPVSKGEQPGEWMFPLKWWHGSGGQCDSDVMPVCHWPLLRRAATLGTCVCVPNCHRRGDSQSPHCSTFERRRQDTCACCWLAAQGGCAAAQEAASRVHSIPQHCDGWASGVGHRQCLWCRVEAL